MGPSPQGREVAADELADGITVTCSRTAEQDQRRIGILRAQQLGIGHGGFLEREAELFHIAQAPATGDMNAVPIPHFDCLVPGHQKGRARVADPRFG